jgi:hypothetical protein
MSRGDCFFAGFMVASAIWITLIVLAIRFYLSLQRDQNGSSDPITPNRPSAPRQSVNGDEVISYRTRNGRSDYRFRLARMPDGNYRVYILDHPSYGSRDEGSGVTHRLSDSYGDYVCWTERLNSRQAARQVAAAWADKTDDYIRHGRRF